MKHTENIVVIHLSATAVSAVIGHVVAPDDIRIMGVGKVGNHDFYQGQITHRDRLKGAIKQAIQTAEDMANCRVHSVWLTLATPELVSKNSYGHVRIGKDGVQVKDIVEALSVAKSKDLPSNHYLMHYCQQGIYVDDQPNMLDDAIGIYAQELSVMYHLLMLPVATRQNIQRLLQECDVSIDHMLLDAVSSAEYSLMPDEREQGVCLIDIGASTTSVCVYKENKLIFTCCVPQGGHTVTMDVSADMGISMLEAENLKKRHGTVDINSIDPSQFLTIHRQEEADEITINLHALAEVIQARYIEIYREVFQKLSDANLLDFISRGVVLSGGGANIHGMVAFAKKFLHLPVFLSNTHSAISAYNHFNDDDSFKQLSAQVQDRSFQAAFGALLYSQSDQFRFSEKSAPEALQTGKWSGMMQRLNQALKRVL